MSDLSPRAILADLFAAAVAAADPRSAIRANLPSRPAGRTIVLAFGKAATGMAKIFEEEWGAPVEGLVVDRHGIVPAGGSLRHMTAAHPVPDAAGLEAAEALVTLADGATADDLVVVLASGGGSALLPAPVSPLTLADEIAVNEALLASGLPIGDMNVVRAHLSRIKGGALAARARPARVVTFVVSDVPGDDPALVSSGPSIAVRTGPATALAIVERARLWLPSATMEYLRDPMRDTPARADGDAVHIVASATLSLEAAALRARDHGIDAVILSDCIEGEAREIGRMHAAIARQCSRRAGPFAPPVILMSGGETSVSLDTSPPGRGGRNSEGLLACAIDLAGLADVHALFADTDGIDGSEANAGAFADGGLVARVRDHGLDPRQCLDRHDAFTAFEAGADLFVTGPTGTNVNDFRTIFVVRTYDPPR